MKVKLYMLLLVMVLSFVLISCNNINNDINDSSSNANEEILGDENASLPEEIVVFDITQFNGISSEKLVSILGIPDDITNTTYYGFAEFPYTVYDYKNHELGSIQFDLINDKVTALTIIGELPYNHGNVLETLNVKITNENNISQDELYVKYEIPTDNIDLIHATLIDSENDTYKQLSIQYDSRYYLEWNLPIFAGTISPGEYRVMVEELIKSMCYSPASADFPTFDWEYARNDYYFCVESYVDAKNAFGTEVRHYFSIVYYNDTTAIAYAILDSEVIADNGYVPTANLVTKLATPSGSSSSNLPSEVIDNYVDDCALYTAIGLPITIANESGNVVVKNIEYMFFPDNRSQNACAIGISFDLVSEEYISGFNLKFSLVGEKTGKVQEYEVEGINVYGSEGNYISVSTDYYEGTLPIDNYYIVFENVIETPGDNSNLSVDELCLYIANVKLENNTGSVMFFEVSGSFVGTENGMCNLSISFFGDIYQDNFFYLDYSLVGEYTGTILEFSEYIYDYSDYHDGYYNFVFTIEHNDIPIDHYTIVFEDLSLN